MNFFFISSVECGKFSTYVLVISTLDSRIFCDLESIKKKIICWGLRIGCGLKVKHELLDCKFYICLFQIPYFSCSENTHTKLCIVSCDKLPISNSNYKLFCFGVVSGSYCITLRYTVAISSQLDIRGKPVCSGGFCQLTFFDSLSR